MCQSVQYNDDQKEVMSMAWFFASRENKHLNSSTNNCESIGLSATKKDSVRKTYNLECDPVNKLS